MLYPNDISKLYAIFEDCKNIDLIAGLYKLETPDDLNKLDEDIIYNLEINGYDPVVHLKLMPNEARVVSMKDGNIQVGMVEEIRQLLESKKKKFNWFFEGFIGVNTLLFISVFYLFSTIDHPSTYRIVLSIIMFITYFSWSYWIFFSHRNRYSIIHTKNIAKNKNIFYRTKDDIFSKVVAGVIGGMITFLFIKYF